MLFQAWQQTFLTGCAPAALVAAQPSFALMVKSLLCTGMPVERLYVEEGSGVDGYVWVQRATISSK